MVEGDGGRVVVDTSVVSIIFNNTKYADAYRELLTGRELCISFQVWEESLFGTYRGNWGEQRRNELARHLAQYTTIWANPDLVEISARLRDNRQRAGRELKSADAWVAATALMLQCPLASHDRDFTGIPDLNLLQVPVQ